MDEALILLLEKKDFEYITVKEICDKAGVNRSTFYLHYDSMTDLLEESAQYFLKNFYVRMQKTDDFDMSQGERGIKNHIQKSEKEDLYLVTPKYLTPYLEFIRDNKRIYSTTFDRVRRLSSFYIFRAAENCRAKARLWSRKLRLKNRIFSRVR